MRCRHALGGVGDLHIKRRWMKPCGAADQRSPCPPLLQPPDSRLLEAEETQKAHKGLKVAAEARG